MSTRSLGSLTLDLVARIGGFTQGLTAAERAADRSARNIANRQKQAAKQTEDAWKNATRYVSGALAGVSVAGLFTTFIRESVDAANEQAQLAAALKSTGEAAGFSAQQLNAMAASMADNSIFSEGDINKAQTRLLAYTNIVGEQFPEAMQAVIDMSARLGMSVEQSAETIGKALDVPSQGLTALSRQGFRFTEEQKKAVEQLEKTGQTAKAQAIVLDALKASYGGAAAAARDTLGGALLALQEQFRTLLTGSDGSVGGMKDAVEELIKVLRSPEVKAAFDTLGTLIANTIGLLVRGGAAFLQFGKDVGEGLAIRLNGDNTGIRETQAEIEQLQASMQRTFSSIERMSEALSRDPKNDFLAGRIEKARERLVALQRQAAAASDRLKQTAAGITQGDMGPPSSAAMPGGGATGPNAAEVAALAKAAAAREAAAKASKEAIKDAQAYLENLRKQLQATEDLTVAETVRRDIEAGRVKLAGGVTKQQLLDLAMQIDMDKELARIAEQFKKLEEESLERKKALKEAGKAIYDATRTPAEQLNIELTKLNDLLAKGAIDWDTYSRAVFDAQDKFEAAANGAKDALSEWDQFKKTAIENTQGALSDALFNGMQGKFDDLLGGFTQMLQRMVAEAIAADIMRKILGNGSSGGSGSGGTDWLDTAFKFAMSFFGGRAAGGAVTAGGMYRVNENGPEMLEMNGQSYLMMGSRGGNVSPNGAGTNVVNNFSMSGNVDRRTEAQIGRAATRGVQRAQRWM